ncbi:MAG TPA: hypothetical protein VGN69_09085 [Solirubrobacteraceae bacterium]|nr:hypothetical protein [Solirubrobacteraceae bacterium]
MSRPLTASIPSRRGACLALVLGAGLVLLGPGSAAGAGRPVVHTGPATQVTPSSATLTGSINPNGRASSYFFQFGVSRSYSGQSGFYESDSRSVNEPLSVPVSNLAADTTYHYRLVAINEFGRSVGPDRSLKTAKIPLSLAIVAYPNPVAFRSATTIAGTLSGTGNGNRAVQLQANAFPYTGGFVNQGNPELTNPSGTFAFNVLSLSINTQFRVITVGSRPVASPPVTAEVAVTVGLSPVPRRVRRGARVRFRGSLTPAEDGAPLAVQKLVHRRWVTVAGTSAHHGGRTSSSFQRRVRVRRSGLYRVYATIRDGAHYRTAISSPVYITAHR